MKTIKICLIMACGLMLAFTSCLKEVVKDNEDHSIKLTFDTIRITKGVTQYLAAKNYEANQVNWSSTDTTTVKIDKNGLITAYKAGMVTINAAAKQYAVSAKCIVIVINDSIADGFVSDVAVGANGSVFAIGTDVVSPTGGFGIYKVAGSKLTKIDFSAGVRIAVSPTGKPWVVNKSHLIYQYTDSLSYWTTMPGTATDIGIGSNGSVYITGTNEVSATGDFAVMKWNGNNWTTIPNCAGVQIAVGPNDVPWVINKAGIVYKYAGNNAWAVVTGINASDIGVGADGSVYVIAKNGGGIYKYANGTWLQSPAITGISISVTTNGLPVWVDMQNKLHKP